MYLYDVCSLQTREKLASTSQGALEPLWHVFNKTNEREDIPIVSIYYDKLL